MMAIPKGGAENDGKEGNRHDQLALPYSPETLYRMSSLD